MIVLAIAMFGIASTSLLLTIALHAAFLRFGRARHATYWAGAFAAFTLHHLAMAFRLATPGEHQIPTLISTTASLAGSVLVAMGFRERSGLRAKGALLASFVLVALVCGVLVVLFPVEPVHHPLASAYAVVVLWLSIQALRKGPEEGLDAARVTLVMMAVFLAFFAALTVLGLMTVPWGPLRPELYRGIYILGVPASLTGIGLFALFLLAEDLAHGMRNLAIVDPLTGLLNRRGFEEAARRMIAQCRRSGLRLCVVLADLDHFKAINDRFGHQTGDVALVDFARRLREALRESDLVSRRGGEEFILLLPGLGAEEVSEMLERLRETLSRGDPGGLPGLAQGFVMPTASFGAAEISALDALEACIERADRALYEAKREGRDCVRVAPRLV
jgi:diguanylate cyclase (GGDEF)-like protein